MMDTCQTCGGSLNKLAHADPPAPCPTPEECTGEHQQARCSRCGINQAVHLPAKDPKPAPPAAA